MNQKANLNGDIQLALASLAAVFRVDADALPVAIRDRALATLRALSAAHYNAGVRDMMARFADHHASRVVNEHVTSSSDVTPIVGPRGRRLRKSRAPNATEPPPSEDDDPHSHR